YIPSAFAIPDLANIHAVIERHSFAILVSPPNAELMASHLPLLLDRAAGPSGTLLGHMARANPQWRQAAGQNVLAIFSGPHAYVSPSWYEARQVVPTWNYLAVHAYGRLELIEEPVEVEWLLHRMVATYESPQPEPWRFDEPADYVERMLKQIVAFRIPVDRLEGKAKLNQNHPEERRQKVAAVLAQRTDDDSQEIARLMRSAR